MFQKCCDKKDNLQETDGKECVQHLNSVPGSLQVHSFSKTIFFSDFFTPLEVSEIYVEAPSCRHEMINWVNELLQSQIMKVEEMGTGAAYCQLMDHLFPGKKSKNCFQEFSFIRTSEMEN